MCCAQAMSHIELENTRNHDHGLRSIALLKHCKPQRLGTINDESAAEAAPILNHPAPRLFWPIRKSEGFELVGGSPYLMAISLTMLESAGPQ
jgi:hypothetical protein